DVLFSSRRAHTRFSRDWSSDVCSSDLQLLGFVFLLERLAQCRRKLVHDVVRRVLGNREALPGIDHDVVVTQFLEGGDIGQIRYALCTCNGQRLELASLHVGQYGAEVLEGRIYLAAEQVCDSCSTSAVGHVHASRTCFLTE